MTLEIETPIQAIETSFSGYLSSKKMPERTGVSLTDYINSTRELSELLPDHRVRVNIFYHEYFDDVLRDYVFPVVIMGEILKDEKAKPFGSIYERIFSYSDPDPIKLSSKEKDSMKYVNSLAKVFEDFNIEGTLIPQLPEGYERFYSKHEDVFEIFELPEEDIWFLLGVIDKEEEFRKNGQGESFFSYF